MMAVYNKIRIAMQILSTLFVLIGIGFTASCLLSSGWQVMIETGSGEIHLHGLWFDYVYSTRSHLAGMPAPQVGYGTLGMGGGYGGGFGGFGGFSGSYGTFGPGEWIMTYKFGDAVYGNEVHRAMPYQTNTLVLLILTLVCVCIGTGLSYCASIKIALALTWSVLLLIGIIMMAGGLIQFYVSCMMPEYRFVYTDRRLEQYVAYAFWWGVAGVISLLLATVTSIACTSLLILIRKNSMQNDTPQILTTSRRADYAVSSSPVVTTVSHFNNNQKM